MSQREGYGKRGSRIRDHEELKALQALLRTRFVVLHVSKSSKSRNFRGTALDRSGACTSSPRSVVLHAPSASVDSTIASDATTVAAAHEKIVLCLWWTRRQVQ
jgi:hypothetical protein